MRVPGLPFGDGLLSNIQLNFANFTVNGSDRSDSFQILVHSVLILLNIKQQNVSAVSTFFRAFFD